MGQAAVSSNGSRGVFGWVRRVDDAVFAVEKAVVVAFLIAMTVMVFFDVVYRRLISPDSKIGQLLGALAGVRDETTQRMLDQQVAPWVGAVLGILLLWFGFWTAERHSGKRMLPIRRSALVLGVLAAAGITALGWLMLHPGVPSKVFYLVVYGLVAGTWLVRLVRTRPPGWAVKAGMLLVVVTPLFAYLALNYMPEGFSWSKELSLILLLWIGFLGASICAHEGKHLRMEAFDRLVPPALARWFRALGFLLTAAFCALMGWLGHIYIFGQYGAYDLGGSFEQTGIPDWVATFAVPVGFGLAVLRFLGAAISALLGGGYGRPSVEESLKEAQRAAAEGEVGAATMDGGHPPEQAEASDAVEGTGEAER
ncbi:MAG: TRAP transporter small permease [Myxococcota bacterium]